MLDLITKFLPIVGTVFAGCVTLYITKVTFLKQAFLDEKNDKNSRIDAWQQYKKSLGYNYSEYRARVLDKLPD